MFFKCFFYDLNMLILKNLNIYIILMEFLLKKNPASPSKYTLINCVVHSERRTTHAMLEC